MEMVTTEQVKDFIEHIADIKALDTLSELIINKRNAMIEQEWIKQTKERQLQENCIDKIKFASSNAKIRIVAKRPGEQPRIYTVENNYETLQKMIGGEIIALPYKTLIIENPLFVLFNENAMVAEDNIYFGKFGTITGNIIFLATNSYFETVSLNEIDLQWITAGISPVIK